MDWALAIHGGAGIWDAALHDAARHGLRAAAELGRSVLSKGGAALDAVCAIVSALEDDPLFNAGTGSVLNHDGDVEMDAAVMRGHDLGFGAVAAIGRVRNPVLVARSVLQRSAHALLAGEGAVRFARSQGFADYDPVTPRSRADWQRAVGARPVDGRPGTVGAVALDSRRRLAAATSTGGMLDKLPGRIGDSPLPGAGTYATGFSAVSATGRGELVMRVLGGKRICDLVESGRTAQAAADEVLQWMATHIGAEVGFIVVSVDGGVGVSHRTPFMPYAFGTSENPELIVAMQKTVPIEKIGPRAK